MPEINVALPVDLSRTGLGVTAHEFVDELARRLRQDLVSAQIDEKRSAMNISDCTRAVSTVGDYIREIVSSVTKARPITESGRG